MYTIVTYLRHYYLDEYKLRKFFFSRDMPTSKYNLLHMGCINCTTIYSVLARHSDCSETKIRTTDKTRIIYSSEVVTRDTRILSEHTSTDRVITFEGLEYGFPHPPFPRTHYTCMETGNTVVDPYQSYLSFIGFLCLIESYSTI